MLKTAQLSIPNACHEDWQSMAPVEKGRYCTACKKNVVDFTNMSDREILNYVSRANGRICGRLHNDQLDRNIISQKESRIPWLKYFFQFTLPAFLVSLKTQGQSEKPATVQLVKDYEEKATDTGMLQVKGRIVDDQGNPVAGASVMIKGTSTGTSTDNAGHFTIIRQDNKPITLIISFIGLMTMEIQSVKLSPNPVATGNNINVELNFIEPGEYQIEMSDLTGICVRKQTIKAGERLFRTTLHTAGLQPGNYVVCIRNSKSKKIGVKKILVQY